MTILVANTATGKVVTILEEIVFKVQKLTLTVD